MTVIGGTCRLRASRNYACAGMRAVGELLLPRARLAAACCMRGVGWCTVWYGTYGTVQYVVRKVLGCCLSVSFSWVSAAGRGFCSRPGTSRSTVRYVRTGGGLPCVWQRLRSCSCSVLPRVLPSAPRTQVRETTHFLLFATAIAQNVCACSGARHVRSLRTAHRVLQRRCDVRTLTLRLTQRVPCPRKHTATHRDVTTLAPSCVLHPLAGYEGVTNVLSRASQGTPRTHKLTVPVRVPMQRCAYTYRGDLT